MSYTTNTTPPATPKKKSTSIVTQSPYFSPSKSQGKDEGFCESVPRNSNDPPSVLGTKLNTLKHVESPKSLSSENIHANDKPHDSSYMTDLKQSREILARLKPDLIQERVANDPWKLLVAVTLLNKTAGKLAIPVFYSILERWPTPYDLSQAAESELVNVIRHLGTQNIRTKRLIAISKTYVQDPPSIYDIRPSSKISTLRQRSSRSFSHKLPVDGADQSVYTPTPISHYPGTGRYALDSYRIFSTIYDDLGSEEWKAVLPTDKELILFLKWKWAFTEGKEWSPTRGVIRDMTPRYLSSLTDQLEKNTVTSSANCKLNLIPDINNK